MAVLVERSAIHNSAVPYDVGRVPGIDLDQWPRPCMAGQVQCALVTVSNRAIGLHGIAQHGS